MKSTLRPLLLVAVVCALPAQSLAQATTVYGYDVHGRLTQAGTTNNDTTTYVLDGADNRGTRRCCEAIGGAQVLDDGFDPYFYLQTYADIRAAGMDPYQHWLQYGASENRWPNRYFNTGWYRTTYSIPAAVNPLTDCHNGGWQAGRNPSPEFSTTVYHAHYPMWPQQGWTRFNITCAGDMATDALIFKRRIEHATYDQMVSIRYCTLGNVGWRTKFRH